MAGERRIAVIEAMDLPQLQANKAALSAELRIAMTKRKTYEQSLRGVLEGAGDSISSITTALPEAIWRGKMVDYDATTQTGVLAGSDGRWPQDAQQVAAALGATNARIEQLKSEGTKKDEEVALAKVRTEQVESGRGQPTTATEYYNRLVQIYRDSEVAGKGKPASASTVEVERAKQWVKDQTQFINSIPAEMRPQIVQYGLEGDRWQGDFK